MMLCGTKSEEVDRGQVLCKPGSITLRLWDAYHRRALEMTSANVGQAR
jgi:translation elongation factor EF-Tu-like GTPase